MPGKNTYGKASGIIDADHRRINLLVLQERGNHADHGSHADDEDVTIVSDERLFKCRPHWQRKRERPFGGRLQKFLGHVEVCSREMWKQVSGDFYSMTGNRVDRPRLAFHVHAFAFTALVNGPISTSPARTPLLSLRVTTTMAKQSPCRFGMQRRS